MKLGTVMICVVIPYYQKSPEPLRKAIASVFSQEGVPTPHILIVDDESPVPAEGIISTHFPDRSAHIRIIVQKNAGAAAARNTGLDNLPEDTRYVAFLDSDDEWTPKHLANAVRMLESGCDFYFAGHKRDDWDEDKFCRIGFSPDSHKCLDREAGLYEYSGDIFRPVMIDHLIQTSSVVFRQDSLGDIRFPVRLVLGEDEVFWVKAMRLARKTGFCRHVEVQMGRGVNISQGGTWGDDRSFQLLSQNMLYWKQVSELFPEEEQLGEIRKLRMKELRLNLAASVLHALKRGKGLPMRHIASCTSTDPFWIFNLVTFPFNRSGSRS